MFWKNADPRLRRLRLSISVRLTLLYTLTSFVAVAAFTGVLYWMLTVNFNTEHLRFLRGKAQELVEDFRDGGDRPQAVLAEIAKETGGTAFSEYRARVLGPAGAALGATPAMGVALPPTVFPPKVAIDAIDKRATSDRYVGGRHLVLVAFAVGPQAALRRTYTVQLALDVTRDDVLLADYRDGLLLFLALLLPVLLGAGYLVTRQGLRPLERITRAALEVTPARLDERIPLNPPWPPELAELVQVFNDMMARLEEAFARLSRFSADLAHELRTPLNNLMGEMEVGLSRVRSAETYRETLASGLEECRRLTTLIENLLFIARTEEAGRGVVLAKFDARKACERVLTYHATAAEERGVRLVCEGAAELCADPILFRQALSNLLTNAIRHSPAGAVVRVVVRTPQADRVDVEVYDRGEGIAPEHLPHVFDRFYQADPSRSSRGQGTGLGLSIVRSIMQLHGGTASLESQTGAGTVAKLHFTADTSAGRMTGLSSG
ncbi:MAG: heavy metal sensor histidine kinase [Gammaproteobacteria bacterium]